MNMSVMTAVHPLQAMKIIALMLILEESQEKLRINSVMNTQQIMAVTILEKMTIGMKMQEFITIK